MNASRSGVAPRLGRARGFTLIELVVAIVIIGILAAIAFPIYQSVTANSRAAAAEASMRALLSDAQTLAKARNDRTFKDRDVLIAVSELSSALPGVSAAEGDWKLTAPPTTTEPSPEGQNTSGEWQRIGYVVSNAQRPSFAAATVQLTDGRCVYGFASYGGGVAVKHTDDTAEEIYNRPAADGESADIDVRAGARGVGRLAVERNGLPAGSYICVVSAGTDAVNQLQNIVGQTVITPSAPLPPGQVPVPQAPPAAVVLPDSCDAGDPFCAQPPTAPELRGTAGNARNDLNWSIPAGAQRYHLYRYVDAGTPVRITPDAGTTGTSFIDRAVVNGTAYTYFVTAVNAAGEGAPSNQLTLVPTGPVPPDPPLSLVAVGGDTRVDLSWLPPATGPTPTSYSIFRRVSATIPGGPAVEPTFSTTPLVTGRVGLTYPDTAVQNGVTYEYYVVSVISGAGSSAASNLASATPIAPPRPPRNLTTLGGDTTVLVRWEPPLIAPPVEGRSYVVRVLDPSGAVVPGKDAIPVAYDPPAGLIRPQLIVTGLVNGTTYTFEVRTVSNGQLSAPIAGLGKPVGPQFRTLGVPGGTTGDLVAGYRDGAAVRPVFGCPVVMADGFNREGAASPEMLVLDSCIDKSIPISAESVGAAPGANDTSGNVHINPLLMHSVDEAGAVHGVGVIPDRFRANIDNPLSGSGKNIDNSAGPITAITPQGDGTYYLVVNRPVPFIVSYDPATKVFATITGGVAPGNSLGYADGDYTTAQSLGTYGVTRTPIGNIVTDSVAHTVRLVANNQITTIAGAYNDGNGAGSQDSEIGTSARFRNPRGVTYDADTNSVLIADAGNHRIRRMSLRPPYAVTTVVGGPAAPATPLAGTTDGVGDAARLVTPDAITIVPGSTPGTGTAYIADSDAAQIRSLDLATNTLTTLAGSGTVGYVDGAPGSARFALPRSLVARGTTLYVVDTSNNRIRTVALPGSALPVGTVGTLAGSGRPAVAGGIPGATFASPTATATVRHSDGTSTIYIADEGANTIRRFYQGVVGDYAGGGVYGPGTAAAENPNDGIGPLAKFAHPADLTEGPVPGVLYVADTQACQIRKIVPVDGVPRAEAQGDVFTLAGGVCGSSVDGTGREAQFGRITSLDYSPADRSLYLTDGTNRNVRRIPLDANGNVAGPSTTVAGPGAEGPNGTAKFASLGGIVATNLTDPPTLYVTNPAEHTVYQIIPGLLGGTSLYMGTPNTPGRSDPANLHHTPVGIDISPGDDLLFVNDSGPANAVRVRPTLGSITLTLTGATNSVEFPKRGYLDGPGNATLSIDEGGGSTTTAGTDGSWASFGQIYGLEVVTAGPNPTDRILLNITDVYTGVLRTVTAERQDVDQLYDPIESVVGTIIGEPHPTPRAGRGASAALNFPDAVARAADGNVYVADTLNDALRRISPNGSVTTLTLPGALHRPRGVTVAPDGSVWVTDATSATNPAGRVSRYVPSSTAFSRVASGLHPEVAGIAVDASGAAYVATPSGVVSISSGAVSAPITAALAAPRQVVLDEGVLYIAESGANRVVTVPVAGGTLTPLPTPGLTLRGPEGVVVGADAAVYVSDTLNQRVVRVSSDRSTAEVYTTGGIAGIRDGQGRSNTGTSRATELLARLALPRGLAIDPVNNQLYLADSANSRIVGVMSGPGRAVANLAGDGAGFADAGLPTAQFDHPIGVTAAPDNVAVVTDTLNHDLRLISSGLDVSTLAGSGPGSNAFQDGLTTGGWMSRPARSTYVPDGRVLTADTGNHRIRVLSVTNTLTTLAGSGTPALVDGPAATAQFSSPQGVAIAPDGMVYVADTGNRAIRAITPVGEVSTITSTGLVGPVDIAYNPATGRLLVTDSSGTSNQVFEVVRVAGDVDGPIGSIRLYSTGSEVSATTGEAGPGYAQLRGLDVAPSGVAYLTDGNSVRVLRADGSSAVIAGSQTTGGYSETSTEAGGVLMDAPGDVAVREDGALFVADTNNNRVRVIGAG